MTSKVDSRIDRSCDSTSSLSQSMASSFSKGPIPQYPLLPRFWDATGFYPHGTMIGTNVTSVGTKPDSPSVSSLNQSVSANPSPGMRRKKRDAAFRVPNGCADVRCCNRPGRVKSGVWVTTASTASTVSAQIPVRESHCAGPNNGKERVYTMASTDGFSVRARELRD